jgi:hypothetical protein
MRLFGKEPDRPKPITAALSQRGVVGFDLGFSTPSEIEFASILVSSGLEWFWVSTGFPEERSLTQLRNETKHVLVEDLLDNGNAEGREITMFGLEPDCRALVQTPLELTNALHGFALSGTGPIRAIYSREDDGDAALYAVWPLTESVRSLLAAWLVRTNDIRELTWADWSKWQTTWLEGAIQHILDRAKV